MFGVNAAWWNAAANPLVPCNQQRPCMAAEHMAPVQSASSTGAPPLSHVLNSDGRLSQEVLQHQSQQPSYLAPSMLDDLAVGSERLIYEQGGYTSASTQLPSQSPALGSVGSENLKTAQFHGLPLFSQMQPKDSYGLSVLHNQLNFKRKHAIHDLDNADTVPYKMRATDENMAARLQGLCLSRQYADADDTTTAAAFAGTTGAAALPAFASKQVPLCDALNDRGWKKFHEVEQRLSATEEASDVCLDCQETSSDSARGASQASQLECLRLELSPELRRQLAITELQTAAIQYQRPQPSLALVPWTGPAERCKEAAKQADEKVNSRGSASTKQTGGVELALEEEEEEKDELLLLVELSEDTNAGSTCTAMATSTPFVGPESTPSGLRFSCDNDGFMET